MEGKEQLMEVLKPELMGLVDVSMDLNGGVQIQRERSSIRFGSAEAVREAVGKRETERGERGKL